jgi:hypothetical protein
MYIEGMNEEFRPPEERPPEDARRFLDGPGPNAAAAYSEPPVRVLTEEEEERVRRQSERFKEAAPVPGFGQPSTDALEARGFQVRKVD